MSRKTPSKLNAQRAVAQSLASWQQAGVTHTARSKAQPAAAAEVVDAKASTQAAATPPTRPVPAQPAVASPGAPVAHSTAADFASAPAMSPQQRVAALEVIRGEVAACVRCQELASTRSRTVFGVGTPQARLVFLGEAPGADEDRQGEPFVGRAGQLLTKIIEACTLRRENVYILNVLKCRPPGNRTPLPDEVEHCRGYLERQLEVIRPEFICCLGAVAARTLLDTTMAIGKMRGQFFNYRGASVLCTYHPSYLLRNPAAKKDVWEDMQLLMARMGIDLAK